MNVPVRATRAYLAGFGTAGSLVAGAALLFVLGSAIVAFRGWPQIGGAPATTVVAAARLSSPSHVAVRLEAALRRQIAGPGSAGAPPAGTAATHRAAAYAIRSPGGGQALRAGGTAAASAASGAPAAATSPSPNTSGSASCGAGCNQPASTSVITHVTDAVAQTVSNVGAQVGTQVSQGSGSAAGSLSGTSPQVATAVENAGSSAGSAVSATTTTAGGLVSQVGNSVASGH